MKNKNMKRTEQISRRFNIWIRDDDVQKIKEEANRCGISISSFIKMTVMSKINGDKENENKK